MVSMRWKRGNAVSSPSSVVDVPAVSMTPQQKLSLEEALATVASWDRLMGTEEEEQQRCAAAIAPAAPRVYARHGPLMFIIIHN